MTNILFVLDEFTQVLTCVSRDFLLICVFFQFPHCLKLMKSTRILHQYNKVPYIHSYLRGKGDMMLVYISCCNFSKYSCRV